MKVAVVVVTFDSVFEILMRDNSSESSIIWAILNMLKLSFLWCCFVSLQSHNTCSFKHIKLTYCMLFKVVLSFESVDEIVRCNPSNESNSAVFLGSLSNFSREKNCHFHSDDLSDSNYAITHLPRVK